MGPKSTGIPGFFNTDALSAEDQRTLLDTVAAYYSVSPNAIISRRRVWHIVRPRWAFMAACHKQGMIMVEIALLLGLNHSTVSHGLRRAHSDDYDLAAQVEEILSTWRRQHCNVVGALQRACTALNQAQAILAHEYLLVDVLGQPGRSSRSLERITGMHALARNHGAREAVKSTLTRFDRPGLADLVERHAARYQRAG